MGTFDGSAAGKENVRQLWGCMTNMLKKLIGDVNLKKGDLQAQIDELDKKIEEAKELKATLEAYGMVKLSDSAAVTDSTGLALPATEKNSSLDGTLANMISQLNTNKIIECDIADGLEIYIGCNTLEKYGKIVHLCIDFKIFTDVSAGGVIFKIPNGFRPKNPVYTTCVDVTESSNNIYVTISGDAIAVPVEIHHTNFWVIDTCYICE